MIYPDECPCCTAKNWCKLYSGEIPLRAGAPGWCNPKYRLDKAVGLSRIPKRYRQATVHNYKVDDDNRGVFEEVIKPVAAEIVTMVADGNNFVFHNKRTGTGKTYAGIVLLNHYIHKTCLTSRFDFETPTALFVEYASLIDDLRYRRDEEETRILMEAIEKTPFLMLDDIGAGTLTPFVLEQTYMILNRRHNNGQATIFTFNLTTEALKEQLGTRIYSRIMNDAFGMSVGGRDRRVQP